MTSTKTSSTATDVNAPGLKRDSIAVSGIVFLVLAAASPILGLTGAVPVTYVIGNGIGVSMSYVLIGLLLLLFAVGFVVMSRHVTDAGALYTYVGKGLGRETSLGTAGLVIYAYTVIQAAIYAFFGATITALINPALGTAIPWWVATLALIAVVQLFGYLHLELGARVLGVLLVGEWGTMLAMAASVAVHGGAGNGFDVARVFSVSALVSGAPGVALMFAFASSLGFEAAAVFGEEVKNPRKSVPRATYVSIVLIALFFTITTWMVTVGYGANKVVAEATKALNSGNTAQLIYTLGDRYLGPWAPVAMGIFTVTSIFACALAFHNGIARYTFTLGRAGYLPKILSRVHHRTYAPIFASLLQTAVAALIVIIFAAVHADPITVVFNWGGGIAVVALVLTYMLVSVSVIVYFRRHRQPDANIWNSLIAPVASVLTMGATLVVIIANFTTLIGGTAALATTLIVSVAVVFLAGILRAVVARRRRGGAGEAPPTAKSGLSEGLS
jgi:amino acid transporter